MTVLSTCMPDGPIRSKKATCGFTAGTSGATTSINRVQNLRKKADFDVTDRIGVQYQATERLSRAIVDHARWIRNETLALELEQAEQPTGEIVETFQIGEDELTVGVRRVTR